MKRAYLCDPAKNITCNKRSCVYNPDAAERICFMTLNPYYAREDLKGNPCTASAELQCTTGVALREMRGAEQHETHQC